MNTRKPRLRIAVIWVVMILLAVWVGSTQQPYLALLGAGVLHPMSVRMVVFQPAGLSHWPGPGDMPTPKSSRVIADAADIRTILRCLAHPDGRAFTRMQRNNCLAVVTRRGGVVTFFITGNAVSGCDVTSHQSSSKLWPALSAALNGARDPRFDLASPVGSLSYEDAEGRAVVSGKDVLRLRGQLRQLLLCYNPYDLQGNRQLKTAEINEELHPKVPRVIVRLVKAATVEAIVVHGHGDWPRNVCDTSSRVESIRFDTIYAFHESRGAVRIVFIDSRRGRCLWTRPVNSLQVVKKAQGRELPLYGTDTFNLLAARMRKL